MGKKTRLFQCRFQKKFCLYSQKQKKKLIIIKRGDHSLSETKSLKRISFELSKIIKNII